MPRPVSTPRHAPEDGGECTHAVASGAASASPGRNEQRRWESKWEAMEADLQDAVDDGLAARTPSMGSKWQTMETDLLDTIESDLALKTSSSSSALPPMPASPSSPGQGQQCFGQQSAHCESTEAEAGAAAGFRWGVGGKEEEDAEAPASLQSLQNFLGARDLKELRPPHSGKGRRGAATDRIHVRTRSMGSAPEPSSSSSATPREGRIVHALVTPRAAEAPPEPAAEAPSPPPSPPPEADVGEEQDGQEEEVFAPPWKETMQEPSSKDDSVLLQCVEEGEEEGGEAEEDEEDQKGYLECIIEEPYEEEGGAGKDGGDVGCSIAIDTGSTEDIEAMKAGLGCSIAMGTGSTQDFEDATAAQKMQVTSNLGDGENPQSTIHLDVREEADEEAFLGGGKPLAFSHIVEPVTIGAVVAPVADESDDDEDAEAPLPSASKHKFAGVSRFSSRGGSAERGGGNGAGSVERQPMKGLRCMWRLWSALLALSVAELALIAAGTFLDTDGSPCREPLQTCYSLHEADCSGHSCQQIAPLWALAWPAAGLIFLAAPLRVLLNSAAAQASAGNGRSGAAPYASTGGCRSRIMLVVLVAALATVGAGSMAIVEFSAAGLHYAARCPLERATSRCNADMCPSPVCRRESDFSPCVCGRLEEEEMARALFLNHLPACQPHEWYSWQMRKLEDLILRYENFACIVGPLMCAATGIGAALLVVQLACCPLLLLGRWGVQKTLLFLLATDEELDLAMEDAAAAAKASMVNSETLLEEAPEPGLRAGAVAGEVQAREPIAPAIIGDRHHATNGGLWDDADVWREQARVDVDVDVAPPPANNSYAERRTEEGLRGKPAASPPARHQARPWRGGGPAGRR